MYRSATSIEARSRRQRDSAREVNVAFSLGTFVATCVLSVEVISGGVDRISVGPPYYAITFVPLALPLLAIMAFGPMLNWKRDAVGAVVQRLKWPLILSAIALVGAVQSRQQWWTTVFILGQFRPLVAIVRELRIPIRRCAEHPIRQPGCRRLRFQRLIARAWAVGWRALDQRRPGCARVRRSRRAATVRLANAARGGWADG
jgi:cytochrome c biogenesis factor